MNILHQIRSLLTLQVSLETSNPGFQDLLVRFRGRSRSCQEQVKGVEAEGAVRRVPQAEGVPDDTAGGVEPTKGMSHVAREDSLASSIRADQL